MTAPRTVLLASPRSFCAGVSPAVRAEATEETTHFALPKGVRQP